MKYQRIRELREEHDLVQKDVADYLGISQRSYSYYENGERGISVEMLYQLADFYHVSTDYLTGRTNQKTGTAVTWNHSKS